MNNIQFGILLAATSMTALTFGAVCITVAMAASGQAIPAVVGAAVGVTVATCVVTDYNVLQNIDRLA